MYIYRYRFTWANYVFEPECDNKTFPYNSRRTVNVLQLSIVSIPLCLNVCVCVWSFDFIVAGFTLKQNDAGVIGMQRTDFHIDHTTAY